MRKREIKVYRIPDDQKLDGEYPLERVIFEIEEVNKYYYVYRVQYPSDWMITDDVWALRYNKIDPTIPKKYIETITKKVELPIENDIIDRPQLNSMQNFVICYVEQIDAMRRKLKKFSSFDS